MSNEEYMLENLSQILDDMEIVLPYEQVKEIANALCGAEEQKSMYFGHECIPNPHKAEQSKLEKLIKEMEKERDFWLNSYTNNVASRHNVDPSNVYFEDGRALIKSTGPTR